ncbi:putative Cystatin domain-containing protein [Medicago truncatula]|uniref:Cysteine proteinase inhibitor n=2 Tax=Medicago truncatula TaxID=3880 RepID=G7KCS3_MEDTR|nr:cysteine proteinase inhibitor [Medicago truncatula]AET00144.1 cysteine protease inhibitor cystatin [Medicago truncatula]RHN57519.1 putative Cystatin domain-containing protein [Medicago truncatula]
MAALGGSTEVEYTQNSVEIDNLAIFAVQEHNIKQNAVLEFVRVLNAKKKVVSGTLYDITLETKDGGKQKVYEAKILEKPWLNFKEVQEFKLISQNDDAPSVSST